MRYTALTLIALVAVAAATGAGLQASLSILGGEPATQANPDADGDRIPDAVESTLCGRDTTATAINDLKVGRCQGKDYTLPSLAQTVALPTTVTLGTDKDLDGFPSAITVRQIYVVVDPMKEDPLMITKGHTQIITIDEDDSNAEVPVPSTVSVQKRIPAMVSPGQDADHDGLPSTLNIGLLDITIDRRLGSAGVTFGTTGVSHQVVVDAHDNDASKPVTDKVEAWIPTEAWHNGDGDRDLLPGKIHFEWTVATVNRIVTGDESPEGLLAHISFSTQETEVVIDDDDQDRNNVIQWNLADADGDFIPDAAEPTICKVQDRYSDDDGVCVKADGTGADGSGPNYIPPMLGEILSTVYSSNTGTVYSLAEDVTGEDEGESAPGVGFVMTVGLLAGLVGLARRRL